MGTATPAKLGRASQIFVHSCHILCKIRSENKRPRERVFHQKNVITFLFKRVIYFWLEKCVLLFSASEFNLKLAIRSTLGEHNMSRFQYMWRRTKWSWERLGQTESHVGNLRNLRLRLASTMTWVQFDRGKHCKTTPESWQNGVARFVANFRLFWGITHYTLSSSPKRRLS